MECKIFNDRDYIGLEKQVNDWLKTHPVTPDSMRFQFSTVSFTANNAGQAHTLVLFYVPLRAM